MALPVAFTVSETAGIARTANDPLWFPVCIPLAQSDNVFTTSGLAVRDIVQNALVPVQLVPHTRYGNYGDTSRPLATILCYFRPTLNANETRAFQLEAGTNPAAAAAVSVQIDPTDSTSWLVDTGTGGATFKIPRSGAQSIIRKCTMKTGEVIINSDTGGLVSRGVAQSHILFDDQGHPYPWPQEQQDAEYTSNTDTSGDGTPNGARATERFTGKPASGPRPSKWEATVLLSGPEVACIKLSCIRMKNAGTPFRGKSSFKLSWNGVDVWPPTDRVAFWDVTCDTYLWFFAGTAAFVVDVVNKSTGGTFLNGTGWISDVACKMFGLDFAPTWSGAGTRLTVCDESASPPATTTVAAGSAFARQRFAPAADGSNHLSVTYNGLSGSSTAWRHALLDSTKADQSMGLAIFPWNWRNLLPQGVSWDITTGRLRWEMLNPDQPDVQRYKGTTLDEWPYHVLPGCKQPRWTAWVLPHAGSLTPTQLVAAAKRLAGVCEQQTNGVYSEMTQTGKGGQIPSLLGHVDSEVWYATRAYWDSLPPHDLTAIKQAIRTRAPRLGTPGAPAITSPLAMAALPSSTSVIAGYPAFANVTRGQDAVDMWRRWMDTRIDGARALTKDTTGVDGSDDMYWHAQPIVGTDFVSASPRLGWRDYPMVGTSGGQCGTNDYLYTAANAKYWLMFGERAFFYLFLATVRHHMAIDQEHAAFPDDVGGHSGQGSNYNWQSADRHTTIADFFGGGGAMEFQQKQDDLAIQFLLTGDPVAREALEWVVDQNGRRFFGESPGEGGGMGWDRVNNLPAVFTQGSLAVTVSDASTLVANPGGRWWASHIPAADFNQLYIASVVGNQVVFGNAAPGGATASGAGVIAQWPIATGRAWSWPMHSLAAILRVLGPNVTTSYSNPAGQVPRASLARWLTCCLEKFVASEAWACSPALQASFGGTGVYRATEDGSGSVPVDGVYQAETPTAYPPIGLREAYVAVKWARANGWAADVPQASLTAALGMLERWIKLLLTGKDGLDWSAYWGQGDGVMRADDINISPWLFKIPWITGGWVVGGLSYNPSAPQYVSAEGYAVIPHVAMPYQMSLWKTAGGWQSDSPDDLAILPQRHKYGNANLQGNSSLYAAEVAAWLALEKYHTAGDTARRDHALDLALLVFMSSVLWTGTGTYPAAWSGRGGGAYDDPYVMDYANPQYTYWTTPFQSVYGPISTIRIKNWQSILGDYSLRLLVDGFPGPVTEIPLAADLTASAGASAFLQDAASPLLTAALTAGIAPAATLTQVIGRGVSFTRSLRSGITPRPRPQALMASTLFATAIPGADLTADVNVTGAPTATATLTASLSSGSVEESFVHADTAAGTLIGLGGTYSQLLGTAWKNLSNRAVIENSEAYVTNLVRRNTSVNTDIDIRALIGDWTRPSNVDAWLGVGVFSAAAATGYGVHVAMTGSTATLTPWIWQAGSPTPLAADVVVPAPTAGVSVLRFRKLGSALSFFYEGQPIGATLTDSQITSANQVGLWAGMGTQSGLTRLGFASWVADVPT